MTFLVLLLRPDILLACDSQFIGVGDRLSHKQLVFFSDSNITFKGSVRGQAGLSVFGVMRVPSWSICSFNHLLN